MSIYIGLACDDDSGGGGGGTPSAPTNSIQYNNAGAFGGSSQFTYNGAATVQLGLESGLAIFTAPAATTAATAGGSLQLQAGAGAASGGGIGGSVTLKAGDGLSSNANGGNFYWIAGAKQGSGIDGQIYIEDPTSGFSAIFNTATVAADRTFTFPDASGTFALTSGVEVPLTFSTGLTRTVNTITANLSTGIAGGQSVIGGTAASQNLTLSSTSNAAKGKLLFGISAYDEVNNRLGIGNASPSAALHLKAGTTSASTAPLKLTTGASMTAAEAGAVEYTTDDLFFTIATGTERKRILFADAVGGLTSTRVPFATTNGRLTDDADMTFATDTLTVTKAIVPTSLTLGTAGSVEGKAIFNNVTSGTITLSAVTGALGTVTLRLPAATDTLVAKATTDVFTNKTFSSSTNVLGTPTMTLGSDANGDIYYRSSSVLTRLPPGTAGQVLNMNAGATAPQWSSNALVGALNVNTTAVGNVGVGEDNLITYTVPANTLQTNGDYLSFEAAGTIASNVNAKRIKVYFGATAIFDTGAAGIPISTAIQWRLEGTIIRTGAATQRVTVAMTTNNATLASYTSDTTSAETLSSSSVLKLTGEATTNNDVIQDFMITRVNAGTVDLSNTKIISLSFIIDGGGSAILTGVKGDFEIPFGCTINRATLLADQSGSIVVDIWKDTYANYPPTVADTITAAAKPTISATTKAQDSTLTGWTTSIAAGDTLRFNVDSCTTITRCLVSLKVTKT